MPDSPAPSSKDAQRRRPQRGLLPPELVNLLVPALKVGGLSAGAGTVSGIAAGIVRDVPPVLFGVAAGIQWFALGSSYWFSRSAIIQAWGGPDTLTTRDRIKASTLAGGTAGTVGGLLRGPRNIIPGAIVFAIAGAAGQGFANKLSLWKSAEPGAEDSSWLRSKYSPLRKLTDAEYENFMSEKLLRVEADIALIDERIVSLREEDEAARRGEVGEESRSQGGT